MVADVLLVVICFLDRNEMQISSLKLLKFLAGLARGSSSGLHAVITANARCCYFVFNLSVSFCLFVCLLSDHDCPSVRIKFIAKLRRIFQG